MLSLVADYITSPVICGCSAGGAIGALDGHSAPPIIPTCLLMSPSLPVVPPMIPTLLPVNSSSGLLTIVPTLPTSSTIYPKPGIQT
ncbi:MAG: hypothetical protein NC238_14235 [Dehalobacter sp.]|nr:hypothetical protein [Dehalobacter sp.]